MFTLVKILLLVVLALGVSYVVAPPRGRAWLEERWLLLRILMVYAWRLVCGAVRGVRDEFDKQKGE